MWKWPKFGYIARSLRHFLPSAGLLPDDVANYGKAFSAGVYA
jgi:hypothetical protein